MWRQWDLWNLGQSVQVNTRSYPWISLYFCLIHIIGSGKTALRIFSGIIHERKHIYSNIHQYWECIFFLYYIIRAHILRPCHRCEHTPVQWFKYGNNTIALLPRWYVQNFLLWKLKKQILQTTILTTSVPKQTFLPKRDTSWITQIKLNNPVIY